MRSLPVILTEAPLGVCSKTYKEDPTHKSTGRNLSLANGTKVYLKQSRRGKIILILLRPWRLMGFRQGKGFLSSKKHRFGREHTRKISLCKKLSYSEKTIWRMDLGRSSQTKILGLRTCFYDPGLANTSKDPFGIRSFPDCRKVVHLLIQGAVEKRAQNSYSTKLQDSTAGELPGLPAILLSRAKRWKYPCEDKFSISSA